VIFSAHFWFLKVAIAHFYLGFCRNYKIFINKFSEKIDFCPLFLAICPLLKSKSGHKKAYKIRLFEAKAHFPTFFLS